MGARPGARTTEKLTPAGKRILREFTRIKKNQPFVKVGVQESDFKKQRKDGVTNGLVAVVNEFGTRRAGSQGNITIPSRPFIRSTAEEERPKWLKMSDKLRVRILKGMSQKRALAIIGEQMKFDIKKKIVDLKIPKNEPSTIRAKTRAGRKGDNPLVDKGALLQSIKRVVVGA